MTEVTLYSKPTSKPQVLYAWGQNNHGQLGFSVNSTSNIPSKVLIPLLDPKDEIVKIESGWKSSCILTKKGRLFISESLSKKTAEAHVDLDEGDQKKEDKGNKKKNKDEKRDKKKTDNRREKSNKPPKEEKTKPAAAEPRWIEITQYFRHIK